MDHVPGDAVDDQPQHADQADRDEHREPNGGFRGRQRGACAPSCFGRGLGGGLLLLVRGLLADPLDSGMGTTIPALADFGYAAAMGTGQGPAAPCVRTPREIRVGRRLVVSGSASSPAS